MAYKSSWWPHQGVEQFFSVILSNMSSSAQINFAIVGGFRTLGAAIAFAAIYGILAIWFAVRILKFRTKVDITLLVFAICTSSGLQCVAFC